MNHNKIWASYLYNRLEKGWKAILFTVALASILEHLGYLTVLTKLSMMLLSNFAANEIVKIPLIDKHAPVVIVITDEDFQERYLERSPLNRCVLTKDLNAVLAKSPSIIGVDIDLSPENGTTKIEDACQNQLDDLIDKNASKLVLLVPFPVESKHLQQIKHQWMKDRCGHNANFADGTLSKSMGMVIDHQTGISNRLAEMVDENRNNDICTSILKAKDSRKNEALNSEEVKKTKEHFEKSEETEAINFGAFNSTVDYFPISSPKLASIETLNGHPVFFGGSWGSDDNFSTPMGKLPGVAIHAARYVTIKHQIKSPSKLIGLLIDLVIAFLFSILIEYFWTLYMDIKFYDKKFELALSSAILISFLIAYLSLSMTFLSISQYLFTVRGLLIAPLLIAISMLIDGFITGPVDVIADYKREGKEKNECNSDIPKELCTKALLTPILVIAYLVALVRFWRYGQEMYILFMTLSCYITAIIVYGSYLEYQNENICKLIKHKHIKTATVTLGNVAYTLGKIAYFIKQALFWFALIYASMPSILDKIVKDQFIG